VVLVLASMIVAGLSMVQGRTIESQRNMIRTLFLDSKELSALKMRDLQQKRAGNANNPAANQPEKADPKNSCAEAKDGKGCSLPQATAPSHPTQDKNRTPEKSDDDNSIPNPQRLLNSI
jgi:hypothetical protein